MTRCSVSSIDWPSFPVSSATLPWSSASRLASSPPSVRALQSLFETNQSPDFLQVSLDPLVFGIELAIAVRLEQQREQLIELALQFRLPAGRGGEPFVFQERNDRLETLFEGLIAALGDRLAQQLGPSRVGAGGELGQPCQYGLEPLEPVREPGLVDRQLVTGRRGLLSGCCGSDQGEGKCRRDGKHATEIREMFAVS